ncbi:armadillo-type protein [Scheffersomyces xylosifermentans]|uniref:armadillo-type protein n=1 Tax=Scheffersomyces xylosifermentans TaxID=1304137 RepID=UPI00315CF08E
MAKEKVRGRRADKKSEKVEKKAAEFGTSRDNKEVKEIKEESSIEQIDASLKSPFFGLVDSNELDYFKQAESTLNINAFDSDEERSGFIRSVLEEARGKELKLVTNQICSKLMERLVLFASDRQLKNIFGQFSNHFVALAHHKYSSHVLETLLVRAAALVEKELINDFKDDEEEEALTNNEEEDGQEDVKVTMETLFINMLDEFKPHLKTMIEHQYSSHVLRLIILILAGKELPSTTTSNSTLRSKKSKIARKMIEIKDNDDFNKSFQTPSSFKNQLRELCNELSKNQDTKRMREYAIHKVASPVLQLLIGVEGLVDRDRTFWHLIFLKETEDKDAQEGAFVEFLLSDSVGSHFLESTIKNDGARIKYIERLYKLYMKDRVLKLAKRSTTGVYIIQALLFKLKPVEVEHILDEIIPELSSLISISENQNLDLGQKLIDASISRGNYRRDEIIEQLFLKFAPNYNVKDPQANTSSEFIENVLQLTGSTLGNTRDDWPTAEERRRSLFLEKLMEYDYKFVICVWYNFLALPLERFIQMCYHGVFSHIVERSLVVAPASEGEPKPVLILRKRVLNLFQDKIVNMACNSYGSHIVDTLWHFTIFLPMYKDRIATQLLGESHKVKESTYGRLVWKNWSMELFTRKKYDWKALVKQQEQEYFGDSEESGNKERVKKPIELKMEKLAEEKRQREEREARDENGKRKAADDAAEAYEKRQKLRGRRR